jgi:hypothetical protein
MCGAVLPQNGKALPRPRSTACTSYVICRAPRFGVCRGRIRRLAAHAAGHAGRTPGGDCPSWIGGPTVS